MGACGSVSRTVNGEKVLHHASPFRKPLKNLIELKAILKYSNDPQFDYMFNYGRGGSRGKKTIQKLKAKYCKQSSPEIQEIIADLMAWDGTEPCKPYDAKDKDGNPVFQIQIWMLGQIDKEACPELTVAGRIKKYLNDPDIAARPDAMAEATRLAK